jgi:acetyl-CoA C-acetyltransferase
MADPLALIVGWGRTPVAPVDGALRLCTPHTLAGPLVQAVLQAAGVAPQQVDAVVMGNALGAGGNPARMVALAAGLPDACAALTVDTQCCAGLDAIAIAGGLLASGQASVVVAGGVEAWSRAPIRQHRPIAPEAVAASYERPAFAPDPARDPDLLGAAARYAEQWGITRSAQDAYAVQSHARALAARSGGVAEIVPVCGLAHDSYPRTITPERAARMPSLLPPAPGARSDCQIATLGVSPRADGAGLVIMATPVAARRLGLRTDVEWVGSASRGCAPEMPLLGAALAVRACLERSGFANPEAAMAALSAIELHDAFAVQGLAFCQNLGLDPAQINQQGGGLARGHPIGASGAIALVRLLVALEQGAATSQDQAPLLGLAAIAGAGGLGAAVLVRRQCTRTP